MGEEKAMSGFGARDAGGAMRGGGATDNGGLGGGGKRCVVLVEAGQDRPGLLLDLMARRGLGAKVVGDVCGVMGELALGEVGAVIVDRPGRWGGRMMEELAGAIDAYHGGVLLWCYEPGDEGKRQLRPWEGNGKVKAGGEREVGAKKMESAVVMSGEKRQVEAQVTEPLLTREELEMLLAEPVEGSGTASGSWMDDEEEMMAADKWGAVSQSDVDTEDEVAEEKQGGSQSGDAVAMPGSVVAGEPQKQEMKSDRERGMETQTQDLRAGAGMSEGVSGGVSGSISGGVHAEVVREALEDGVLMGALARLRGQVGGQVGDEAGARTSGEEGGGVSGEVGDIDLVERLLGQSGSVLPVAMKVMEQTSGVAGWWFEDVLMGGGISGGMGGGVSGGISGVVEVVWEGRKLGWLRLPGGVGEEVGRVWAQWLSRWVALERQCVGLWELAFRDELTQAWNRRYFQHFLDVILRRATAERFCVTLMMFDIDDFKIYNDRYGHGAGDEILRQTVELMQSVVRKHDVVARIGGDEFGVIFWDAMPPRKPNSQHPADVRAAAERFQRGICNQRFSKLGDQGQGRLTISGGLSGFPWDGHTSGQLMEKADAMLMESKRHGKNVLTFGPGAMGNE